MDITYFIFVRVFQLRFKQLLWNMKITIKIHFYAGILVWAISFWLISTSGQLILSEALTSDYLPICCEKDFMYSVGFDLCENITVPLELKRPIINATQESNALNVDYDKLFDCEDGFVANISMNFRILENGSLFILSPSEILVPEEHFCIDEFQTYDSEEPTALVARFCAPDPCIGRKCISKCCPHGMVLSSWNYTEEFGYQCQKMALNYSHSSIQLRNEYGVAILPSELEEIPIIRDGAGPDCPGENFSFDPDLDEYFYILPNGSMFYPRFMMREIKSDQYCIDHLLKDDCTFEERFWFDSKLSIRCNAHSI